MGSINMKRILITVLYMTSVVATTALAEGSQCISALKKYENNYQFIDKVSDKKRLAYLASTKELCRDNSVHAIFQSQVLISMAKVDDAFLVLDSAIANYSQPIGDALYEKADLMRRMIDAGFDKESIHQDMSYEKSIFLFLQALKTKTNIKPLIYLGLSESHIAINALDQAIEYAKKGIELDDNIARLYSLLGVIESKKDNFLTAQQYLEISAKKQGTRYLKEPDTVLALAKVLCNAKRKDLVIDLVNKAIKTIPYSEDIPDIQEAYGIAKHCPHPNPLGN
jgi:tetratricopeptide (TPR) repeat protein